jgi:hypothetical protein
MECGICYDLIQDQYAVIDRIGEKGVYHVYCLQRWLKTSPLGGILTQSQAKTYSVFNQEKIIAKNVDRYSNTYEYDPNYVYIWCQFVNERLYCCSYVKRSEEQEFFL